MNAKEIIKKLLAEGFTIKHQTGSHIQMTNGVRHTTVPDHGKKDIGIGLLKSIERQSGIKLK